MVCGNLSGSGRIASAGSAFGRRRHAIVEEIVCKVNSSIVTRTDLDRDRRDAEAEFRHEGLSGRSLQDTVDLAMKGALRQRIDRLLLIAKAKELDVKVDNEVAKQPPTSSEAPASPILKNFRRS